MYERVDKIRTFYKYYIISLSILYVFQDFVKGEVDMVTDETDVSLHP